MININKYFKDINNFHCLALVDKQWVVHDKKNDYINYNGKWIAKEDMFDLHKHITEICIEEKINPNFSYLFLQDLVVDKKLYKIYCR